MAGMIDPNLHRYVVSYKFQRIIRQSDFSTDDLEVAKKKADEFVNSYGCEASYVVDQQEEDVDKMTVYQVRAHLPSIIRSRHGEN
jgi:hypothetical protein